MKNKLLNGYTVWMSALQFSTQHFSTRRIHSGPAIDKLLYWTKFSHTPKVHSFLKQCLHDLCLTKKSGKHWYNAGSLQGSALRMHIVNFSQQVPTNYNANITYWKMLTYFFILLINLHCSDAGSSHFSTQDSKGTCITTMCTGWLLTDIFHS